MAQTDPQQLQETAQRLDGKTVAILVTDGFEQVELTGPKAALEEAGARTVIVAPKAGQVQGFNHVDKADRFDVAQTLDDVRAADFDALLLPGGVVNADALRTDAKAQAFAKAIDGAGKPIAVICHGGWLLVSAGLVAGRTLTSWPSLQDDLRNAGANWVDQEVVSDRNWTSSRKPDDIPAFNRAAIAAFAG
ncbi:type 1 glutamine amidotransferase domain-containing protein [Xylophilus sp.]|uniref:type 1 glutamine amidotransferase domain-containing protein n=1 Tax=Xylophilus sp. TaxID=2653893 RepID=UPI0013B61F21|nr:type 1 glutamine amidotransferase domain-containing protein [Xylophilus sp.]KAF1047302.1 MAG: putative cysteine protease YraA [Xylophilus sp.]